VTGEIPKDTEVPTVNVGGRISAHRAPRHISDYSHAENHLALLMDVLALCNNRIGYVERNAREIDVFAAPCAGTAVLTSRTVID